MLSIDQLVPLPVIGKQQEVVVCELHARIRAHHFITPGHGLIIAIGSETDATSSDSELSRKEKASFRDVRSFVVVEVVGFVRDQRTAIGGRRSPVRVACSNA